MRREARPAVTVRHGCPPSGTGSLISVLVADDQALVRAGFASILGAQAGIAVVGEAKDGRDAVDLARKRRPRVVLMDIKMPDLDGIEATRRILAEAGDETAVLMLTTFDLNEYVYDALRAGASGFLLKDVPPEQLIDGRARRRPGRRADRARESPSA